MAKTQNMMGIIAAVVVVALAAIGSVMWSTGAFSVTDGTSDDDSSVGSGKAEFCANNPSLDLAMRIEDGLASSKDYMNGTVYVQDLSDNSIVEYSINSASGDFADVSNALDCTNEDGYKVWVKADEDNINSDGVVEITADELSSDPVKKEMDASRFSAFKVKVYDNNDRSKVEDDSESTDYVAGTDLTFSAFDGSSADSLDLEMTFRPNTTSRAFGEKMYIAIDTEDENNLADWDETLTLVEFNGQELKEATLSDNEARAMNSYEHVFALPESIGIDAEGVKDSESVLRMYLEPEADETSNDYDVTVRLVPRGEVESTETDKILEDVGFKDDSSRTALYTEHTITFPVN